MMNISLLSHGSGDWEVPNRGAESGEGLLAASGNVGSMARGFIWGEGEMPATVIMTSTDVDKS